MGIRDRFMVPPQTMPKNIRNTIVDIMELHHLGCIEHTLKLSVNKSF